MPGSTDLLHFEHGWREVDGGGVKWARAGETMLGQLGRTGSRRLEGRQKLTGVVVVADNKVNVKTKSNDIKGRCEFRNKTRKQNFANAEIRHNSFVLSIYARLLKLLKVKFIFKN